MTELAQRYYEVINRIESAAKENGRTSDEITLVVVTKNHPASLALELISLGARDLGENRDQEAAPKAKAVASTTDLEINWHFIGQLQSNKVRSVLEYGSYLHSLDRESLLGELEKRVGGRQEPFGVFIQVNLTDDPGRGGIAPEEIGSFADKVGAISSLKLMGLMGVAGLGVEPEFDFERMAGYSAALRADHPQASSLSIGMSSDYEAAIGFGATHLRIGTAITGNRPV